MLIVVSDLIGALVDLNFGELERRLVDISNSWQPLRGLSHSEITCCTFMLYCSKDVLPGVLFINVRHPNVHPTNPICYIFSIYITQISGFL